MITEKKSEDEIQTTIILDLVMNINHWIKTINLNAKVVIDWKAENDKTVVIDM